MKPADWHSMKNSGVRICWAATNLAIVAWKTRVAALSDADAARFGEAGANAAEPFMNGGRLRLVATSLCASGRK
jgi:hypothetical protein